MALSKVQTLLERWQVNGLGYLDIALIPMLAQETEKVKVENKYLDNAKVSSRLRELLGCANVEVQKRLMKYRTLGFLKLHFKNSKLPESQQKPLLYRFDEEVFKSKIGVTTQEFTKLITEGGDYIQKSNDPAWSAFRAIMRQSIPCEEDTKSERDRKAKSFLQNSVVPIDRHSPDLPMQLLKWVEEMNKQQKRP